MENLFCEICGSVLTKLGVLGKREHYNCQGCGMAVSIDLTRFKINKAKHGEHADIKRQFL